MREEFRLRLANEYRYAVTKMQQAPDLNKKMYYFSAFFGEGQRVLNWEWDRDLALIYTVTQFVHTQINMIVQVPGLGQTLPIDWITLCDKLGNTASELASYFEKKENQTNREDLLQILGVLAEIGYAVNGNGSYLLEKGSFTI